jgi:hypothetical protein
MVETLTAERYKVIQRGWMRTNDIMRCTPCGYKKAVHIRTAIEKEISESGFEALSGCIRTERFLDFVGLNKNEILQAYEKMKGEKNDD